MNSTSCRCVSNTVSLDPNEVLGEKLDENYTKMLHAVFNESLK